MTPECPFCDIIKNKTREPSIVNRYAMSLRDKFPATKDHMIIVSSRHVADYFRLDEEEQADMWRVVSAERKCLMILDSTIEGFTVGINVGPCAGQTVMHAHIHLIPRRHGDSKNPRGGVRAVIEGKADYR